jgi:hypothetical protein
MDVDEDADDEDMGSSQGNDAHTITAPSSSGTAMETAVSWTSTLPSRSISPVDSAHPLSPSSPPASSPPATGHTATSEPEPVTTKELEDQPNNSSPPQCTALSSAPPASSPRSHTLCPARYGPRHQTQAWYNPAERQGVGQASSQQSSSTSINWSRSTYSAQY